MMLRVVVDTEGHATDISVLRGVGCGMNEEAISGVKQWRFKPASDPSGQPVTAVTTVEIEFRLY
jgi:TonB family protein